MRFPLNPSRGLGLTSPPTSGPDVKFLQQACNVWAQAHGLAQIAEDGVYGPDTDHAEQLVAYSMGLKWLRPMKATIRLIYHPWMRSPADYLRATQRQSAAPKGVAALPGIAAQYIGIAESPPGSNQGYPEPSGWEQEFGMNGVSWCGCFAGAMIQKAGGHVSARVAYCPYIEQDAKTATGGFDQWTTDPTHAGPGWLVLYDWTGGQSFPEHVGIVESIQPDHVADISGNTGGTNPSDGGMVARANRPFSLVVGFARPRL